MLYHIWDPEFNEFKHVQGVKRHQIESRLGASHVAEKWVEERLDPNEGYRSLDSDGVVVAVRDELGNEEQFRVTGERSIVYTTTKEEG